MKMLLWTGIVILLLNTGCSKEVKPVESNVAVHLSGDISVLQSVSSLPGTRTSMSGSTASFTSNDKIGVFETLTNRSNVLFTYSSSSWSTTTPMYWYNGTSTHTFYAYYPYNASGQGNLVLVPLLSGQAFGTTPDVSCDMLVSGPKTQVRSAGTGVALTFTHSFSLLQFNITAPLINTYTLKTMTIQGGNPNTSSSPYGLVNGTNNISQIGYNIKTMALQAVSNDNSTFSQSITQNIPSVGLIGSLPVTIYAIILPGTYTSPVPALQFSVSSLLGGIQNTKWGNLPNNQFLAGTKYVYSVQVGGILDLSKSSIFPEKDVSDIELFINRTIE